MREKKKVLLLGGTGAMGVYLVPELLKMGYQVYVTSRSDHVSDQADLFYLTGNAKDQAFLLQLLEQKFDAIVDFMIYRTLEFRERYQALLEGTDHYLFVSSYRVYGDNQGNPITEDSPRLLDIVQDPEYLKTDEYGLTKARQENLLRESGARNWTILRPAITYSKERFQLGTLEAADFIKRAQAGKTVIFPKQMLDKQATLSWAGDVAKLISRMIFNCAAMGEAFTVSTSENHTWKEILKIYVDLLGMRVKIVDLSVYQNVVGGPYQIKYDRMLDRVIDNSKALKITGIQQADFMPLCEGLKIELENFLQSPTYPNYSSSKDQKMDEVTTSKVHAFILAMKRKAKTVYKLLRNGQLLKTIAKKLK